MQRIFNVAVVICVVFGVTIADFRNDALNLHNQYRAIHHAPPLSLRNDVSFISEELHSITIQKMKIFLVPCPMKFRTFLTFLVKQFCSKLGVNNGTNEYFRTQW